MGLIEIFLRPSGTYQHLIPQFTLRDIVETKLIILDPNEPLHTKKLKGDRFRQTPPH